jgi:SNF2 family DNA or RNA helicase
MKPLEKDLWIEMVIGLSLNSNKNLLKIKVLQGESWERDLSLIRQIPNRRWDSESKSWEIPSSQIRDIILNWKKFEILPQNKDVDDFLQEYWIKITKIDSLPRLGKDIDFLLPPKPYQERYIRIHPIKNRLICALEMGLGKGLSTLERAKVLECNRLLVICPKVVALNWKREIRQFLERDSIIYQGKNRKKLEIKESDFVICTYESVGEIQSKTELNFDQVIIDEAHLICNSKSKRSKDVKKVLNNITVSNYGLQLATGTPAQHKIRDLWHLVSLVCPELAGSEQSWIERYEETIKSINKEIILKNKKTGKPLLDETGNQITKVIQIPIVVKTKNLEELKERLSSVMFRVKREEVTDFDDLLEVVTTELTRPQRKLYEQIKDEILVDLENRTLKLIHAPVRLLRLLQSSEGLFNFSESTIEQSIINSGKLEYIKHYLDNTDEKVIVWSRFQPITEILGKMYKDKSVIYNGSKSDNYKSLAKWAFNGASDNIELKEFDLLCKKVKDFNFGPGEAQFFFGVIDIKSSLGMNLHKKCNRQIFSSFSFMHTANAQAADRLRRIGQDADAVYTQYLVAEDTFERRALNLIMENYSKTIQALDGMEGLNYKQTARIINFLKGR